MTRVERGLRSDARGQAKWINRTMLERDDKTLRPNRTINRHPPLDIAAVIDMTSFDECFHWRSN